MQGNSSACATLGVPQRNLCCEWLAQHSSQPNPVTSHATPECTRAPFASHDLRSTACMEQRKQSMTNSCMRARAPVLQCAIFRWLQEFMHGREMERVSAGCRCGSLGRLVPADGSWLHGLLRSSSLPNRDIIRGCDAGDRLGDLQYQV